jgi:ribosomal protein S18 acetylase RimI-like enzyme
MKPEDITAGLSLCRSFGWNQLARDWEIFLNLSPNGCRVAELEKVVGTVTTVRYQNHFSWISMVLVDTSKQRQGIGMQLLREALYILKDESTIKLDATPAGREVYLKLNFVDEYPLSRMIIKAVPNNLKTYGTRPILNSDVSSLMKLDHEVFGADRQTLLKWMLEGAPQYAFLVEEKDEIQGYCLGRPGHNYTQIGPVIAKNGEIAKRLVSSALQNLTGSPFVMDITQHDPLWKEWLNSLGFTEQRSFVRMYLGTNDSPGILEKQFAIMGPEFG